MSKNGLFLMSSKCHRFLTMINWSLILTLGPIFQNPADKIVRRLNKMDINSWENEHVKSQMGLFKIYEKLIEIT